MKKMDEYDKLELPALMDLQKSGTVKGTYLNALLDTIDRKTAGGSITQL